MFSQRSFTEKSGHRQDSGDSGKEKLPKSKKKKLRGELGLQRATHLLQVDTKSITQEEYEERVGF